MTSGETESDLERWIDEEGTLCFAFGPPARRVVIMGNTGYIFHDVDRVVYRYTAPDELVEALREGRDDLALGDWEFLPIDREARRLLGQQDDGR